MTREELARDAKNALAELDRSRIRCQQAGLAAEFVDIDDDLLRMARAAAFPRMKLNDAKTSAGAVRRVAREAAAALGFAEAAEDAVRKHATCRA